MKTQFYIICLVLSTVYSNIIPKVETSYEATVPTETIHLKKYEPSVITEPINVPSYEPSINIPSYESKPVSIAYEPKFLDTPEYKAPIISKVTIQPENQDDGYGPTFNIFIYQYLKDATKKVKESYGKGKFISFK